MTDNFLGDVGITQDWFNVGQQLLAAGLSLLEVMLLLAFYVFIGNSDQHRSRVIWFCIASDHESGFRARSLHGSLYCFEQKA